MKIELAGVLHRTWWGGGGFICDDVSSRYYRLKTATGHGQMTAIFPLLSGCLRSRHNSSPVQLLEQNANAAVNVNSVPPYMPLFRFKMSE
jgi:hypothetical protein